LSSHRHLNKETIAHTKRIISKDKRKVGTNGIKILKTKLNIAMTTNRIIETINAWKTYLYAGCSFIYFILLFSGKTKRIVNEVMRNPAKVTLIVSMVSRLPSILRKIKFKLKK